MPNATRNARNRRGLSLVEVLVAVVILALFMAALAPMLSASALLRRQQELIAEATNLAQLEIEEVRRTWSLIDRQGLGTSQNLGGLVPVNMRDRVIPLPRACVLSEVNFPGCTQDPPRVPDPLRLPASAGYPFASDSFEVTSPDPQSTGPADLYLYDPSREPPTTARAASFTMRGLRGPTTYRLQVFWGYAPGSATPMQAASNPRWYQSEVVRVVVRIYLAEKDGELPRDSAGQPTRLTQAARPVVSSRAENLTDKSAAANDPALPPAFSPLAPLVVLSADIARAYQ